MFSVCIPYTDNELYQNQWDYVFTHFQPDNIYIYAEDDINIETNWFKNKTMKLARVINNIANLPDKPLVLLQPNNGRYIQGDTSLIDFTHPEDAIYMFGYDESYLKENVFNNKKPNFKVFVPTNLDSQMYSFMIGAITFYDRQIKNGKYYNR